MADLSRPIQTLAIKAALVSNTTLDLFTFTPDCLTSTPSFLIFTPGKVDNCETNGLPVQANPNSGNKSSLGPEWLLPLSAGSSQHFANQQHIHISLQLQFLQRKCAFPVGHWFWTGQNILLRHLLLGLSSSRPFPLGNSFQIVEHLYFSSTVISPPISTLLSVPNGAQNLRLREGQSDSTFYGRGQERSINLIHERE